MKSILPTVGGPIVSAIDGTSMDVDWVRVWQHKPPATIRDGAEVRRVTTHTLLTIIPVPCFITWASAFCQSSGSSPHDSSRVGRQAGIVILYGAHASVEAACMESPLPQQETGNEGSHLWT